MLSLSQLKKIRNKIDAGTSKQMELLKAVPERRVQAVEPDEVFDPCDETPIEASEACQMLGTIESDGYTDKSPNSSASGRYQFIESTAHDVLRKLGDSTPEATWDECGRSSSDKCKKVQDSMCNQYSQDISNQLKNRGIPATKTNMYMAWQQGAGGASVIYQSALSGEKITNKDVLRRIDNQGGVFAGIDNGADFISTTQDFMRKQGVDV